MKRGLPIALGAAVLLLMALFSAFKLELSDDITHFLAPGDDPRLARLSRRLAESELTRTMILSVEAEDLGAAIGAVDALEDELTKDPEVAWVRTGWNPEHNQAFHELYYPNRLLLTSDDPEELEHLLTDEGLRGAAKELKRQLNLPTSAMVKTIASEDPLLTYVRQLKRLEAARAGTLGLQDNHFVSEGGQAIVILATVHSPFDSQYQRPFQERLEATEQRLVEERGAGLVIEQSGVGRFALKAEETIRGDIQRISFVSTIAIILLFLGIFRSLRLVLLPLVPIAFGVTAATSVSLLLFGSIHGLTLAFGASLIGIAIDYPVHLFNHHVLEPDASGPGGTLKRIRPGLLLGALTTVVGFAGLGWTSFPGVREIAVFASVGISAALLSTMFVLPALLPSQPKPIKLQQALARAASRVLSAMKRRRQLLVVGPALAVVLIVGGLVQVEFEDDVSALTRLDEELMTEDERVRGRVSRMDAGRLVVAVADDEETALQRNDEVYSRLRDAKESGYVEDFRSLHVFLWSAELQAKNRQALQGEGVVDRLASVYQAEGFSARGFNDFKDFRAAVETIPAEPMTYAQLRESPLRELVISFRTQLEGDVGILTFLRGVKDPGALAASVAGVEGVYFFDQKKMMSEIYSRHRVQTLQLVSVGLLGVLLMLFARYRKIKVALAAFLPALLAGGAALGFIAWTGTSLNLLHVVSLLLVLSMGVDYGVFLAESHGQQKEEAATLLSLLIACLSTVCAFGLLAMSDNPALDAIGYTTGLGVCFSLLLAPTTLVLLGTPTEEA
jgi:predicted exporter